MPFIKEITILAIDPGKSKCGLALVHRDTHEKLHFLWHKITPCEELANSIEEAQKIKKMSLLLVGSGTGSKEIIPYLKDIFPQIALLNINEKGTSLAARERYWEFKKRKGLRKLLPATMQVPPEPIDDFVAYILAERFLVQE